MFIEEISNNGFEDPKAKTEKFINGDTDRSGKMPERICVFLRVGDNRFVCAYSGSCPHLLPLLVSDCTRIDCPVRQPAFWLKGTKRTGQNRESKRQNQAFSNTKGDGFVAIRTDILTWSKGDLMETYWKVFFHRQNTQSGWKRDFYTFFLNRSARKHGGYIGKDTWFASRPRLPHGLHGIYISRYAKIGEECWIYQNVTIGESKGKAPVIGDHCLIGAGAVLIGDISIGDHVKIQAGAVVSEDVPSHATVFAPKPTIHISSLHE